MKEVSFDKEARPVILTIRLNTHGGNPERIGQIAKHTLETDENNTAPVELTYQKGE